MDAQGIVLIISALTTSIIAIGTFWNNRKINSVSNVVNDPMKGLAAVSNVVNDPEKGLVATHVLVNRQHDEAAELIQQQKALLLTANETITALRETALAKSEAREIQPPIQPPVQLVVVPVQAVLQPPTQQQP